MKTENLRKKNTKRKSRRLSSTGFSLWWGRVDSPALRGRPGRRENVPLARFLTRLPFESPRTNTHTKQQDPSLRMSLAVWWGRVDSNHRRHCQQIYSLSPLATREHPHIQLPIQRMELVDGFEPPTC